MGHVTVYLPDDLVDAAHDAGLNVSSLTQVAIRRELRRLQTVAWIDAVLRIPATGTRHAVALAALDAAREERDAPGA